ncbi:hypothetical protein ACFPYJ_10290 [Paenibacillus solisilvae]|uniref:Aldose 1-epimerase n=1 Tax=Paenibacillus solisilvae TaxID=2486751 RepID=A0ABW0VUF5_9BACL
MITRETIEGFDVITMESDKIAASLCPALGNNMYRIWDKIKQREVLRTPQPLAILKTEPILYGIPVLMPPNRIRNGRFRFQGREYQLEINTPNGHHIHGFLALNPWEVRNTYEIGSNMSVTSSFETARFPHVLEQFPHDLYIIMRYELKESSLTAILKTEPILYGIPVLMPPNRIRNGRFRFQSREYQLEINTPNGHHIHGFLALNPWEVRNTYEIGSNMSVTSSFETARFPHVLEQFPHDLYIIMRYELKESRLTQYVSITNQGHLTAPIGFGLHPWFLLDHSPEKWMLTLPVSKIWELDSALMPTGRLLPLGKYEAFLDGMNLQDVDLDTPFLIGDQPRTALLATEGYAIRIHVSKLYKHWVIYTGGKADEFIAIEPYTWVTNAPNLPLKPELTGLIALPQGETIHLQMELEIIYGYPITSCP